ncbi:hypothetical protein O3M35_000444 [Rhynocoris fuscipes]|uniref:Uncharacterized protein n=1 Tax=Rhynocoris fuscipes TaxID=488301 RepID=A0AAW1DMH0_9HEMI
MNALRLRNTIPMSPDESIFEEYSRRPGQENSGDYDASFEAEKNAIKLWEQQIDTAYRELIAELQTSCERHIEAMRRSIKELVMHERRKIIAKKKKKIIINERKSSEQSSQIHNIADDEDDDEPLLGINYEEKSVLERIWRHREWAVGVWFCLTGVLILLIINIIISVSGTAGVRNVRIHTLATLCSLTNDSDVCNVIDNSVPLLNKTLEQIEINMKKEFQLQSDKLKKVIENRLKEKNYNIINDSNESPNNLEVEKNIRNPDHPTH